MIYSSGIGEVLCIIHTCHLHFTYDTYCFFLTCLSLLRSKQVFKENKTI